MPAKSPAQKRLMEGVAHNPSFARKVGIPTSVGKEFVGADAGLPIAAGTVFVSPEGNVLLLKRAGVQGVDNYVGHWSLPGGKAEPGETPEQAADRESAEELGNTAPVSKKKLLDRVKTPNGMVFHTFAQPVHSEFQPQLNEEHSECGWFSVGDLPKPLHPSVGRVLRENLGVDGAEDMKPEDWTELRENFAKWTREEEAEPEHAQDTVLTIDLDDDDSRFAALVSHIKESAAGGHSFDVVVDPGDSEYEKKFYMDGDGAFRIRDISVADGAQDNQPALATTVNTGIPLAAWNKKRKKKLAQDSVCPACKGAGCVKCGGSGVAPSTKAPMKPRLGGAAFDMALFMRNMAGDEWNEGDHPRADNGKFGSGSSSSKSKASTSKGSSKQSEGSSSKSSTSEKPALKMADLSKKGGKLGSNEGCLYEGKGGEKFYIKKPGSKAHVANERTAAALYQLAGAKTLDYRDVEGGEHVASEWKQLEKKNIRDFTPAERKEAAHDFAIHAWLSNWDAAGTGGDNQGVIEGKTTTLDVGGSLRFRAQGGPKGSAFGDKVVEWETMRNKGMSPDAAKLFAPMSESEMKASVERVTAIPDAKIRAAVGDDKELADRLIARKKDLASKVGLAHDALSPMLAAWNKRATEESERGARANACPLCGGTGEIAGPGMECDECGGTGLIAQDAVLAFDRAMVMGLHREGMAFDYAQTSVRSIDADGRMHVEVSNISKATVNPYMGKEIPKYRELNLEPDRIYQLLRDPAELEKAASTFNNLPLLDQHVGVNAANHRPEHVVGSTGTDAEFTHPHLKNSLVIWADRGIKAVENKKKKELSSAYRYRADMTPGDYEGVRYDGVMRDIVGNHVALVEEGRAGSDVVVGDSLNPLIKEMTMKALKLSALGTVAYGSLMTFLRPQLAMDTKFDLKRGLRNINAKNFKVKRPTLAAWISESVKDKLDPEYAQDGALNSDGLDAVLDMIELACDDFPDDLKEKAKEKKDDDKAKDEDMSDEDADTDAEDDAETDEEKAARMEARAKAKDKKAKDKKGKDGKLVAGAKDKDVNEEDEDHDPDKMADDEDDMEQAMDAKIQAGIDAGIKKERDRMDAIMAAKDHVRSRVGSLPNLAFDSATGVYAKAVEMETGKKPPKDASLDMLKFAFDNLPSKDSGKKRTYAMDSASVRSGSGEIAKRNPKLGENMARIQRQ